MRGLRWGGGGLIFLCAITWAVGQKRLAEKVEKVFKKTSTEKPKLVTGKIEIIDEKLKNSISNQLSHGPQIEFVVGCKETYYFRLNVDVYCYCCNQLVLNGVKE